jgi:serine/threonine-protein kinase
MPSTLDPSRDLLLGLLALQTGLINQGQLFAAFHAWTQAGDRPMADILAEQGALSAPCLTLVEGLVIEHLRRHGNDSGRSLAALGAGRSTRECLAQIGNPRLDASLAQVGAGSTENGDPDRTASYSLGAATSDGQRFRVLRPHARGGLGAIFVARDTELNREVALKQILDHHADDPVSRARFVLEAEITGGLEHPGIVPVYGLGTHGDGRPYYAMRFIRGDSLKDAITAFRTDQNLNRDPGRRSLALRKLLRRFLDVCNAINYAHTRGVLHRDLKPSNIIVGKHGETLVVDWGLAKALGRAEPRSESEERLLIPSLSSGSAETLAGSALGTPAYMSPEQAAGDLEHLGPHSDVYSLGATLYCLLAGQPPFEDDDVGTVLRGVQKGGFPRPRQFDPRIDPALEAICLKAMALKPEDRYPTPRALGEDIERWTADEPVTAWREPLARQARRWARRNRTAVTAAAVAVLVALGGMATVLAVQARANSELRLSNEALADATARVKLANADLMAANERERERFNLAMDAVKLFHGEASQDLLLKEKPFAGLRTNLLRGAADFYTRLEGLLKGQTDRPSRAALGKAYVELADLTDKIGSKPEALAVHRKALAVRQELAADPEADVPVKADVARSLISVGWLQEQTGDMSGALTSYVEARGLAEGLAATTGLDKELQPVLALAYQHMARALEYSGKPVEALAAFGKSLAIQRKLAEANPNVTRFQADYAEGLSRLSHHLTTIGKPAEALAADEESLAIRQKLADANPSLIQFQHDLAQSHNAIAYLLGIARKPVEALAALEREKAIRRKLADANPNVAEIWFQLARCQDHIGWVLRQTGKPVEAMEAFQQAIAIYRKLADADPSVVRFQSRLALCLGLSGGLHQEAGRHAESAASRRQAVAILERLPTLEPIDRYNLACGHANLAALAAVSGSGMTAAEGRAEAERAMHWLKQAVAAGYRNVALMRKDPDLDSLRSRPDVQLLMMDLEFPDDPFEHGD